MYVQPAIDEYVAALDEAAVEIQAYMDGTADASRAASASGTSCRSCSDRRWSGELRRTICRTA